MATYFHHGNSSEIQASSDGALQTLVLMNPGYVQYSDTPPPPPHQQQQQPHQPPSAGNLVFLNSPTNSLPHHPSTLSHAPPSHAQQFVGIPLSHDPNNNNSPSMHQAHPDLSSLHAFMPRIPTQYALWNSIDPNTAARDTPRAQQGLSLTLSSQQPGFGSFRGATSDREVPSGEDIRVSSGSNSSASGVTNGVSGMQSVLLSSKYLKAAQELLEEVVNVGNGIRTELPKKGSGQQSKVVAESSLAAAGDSSVGGEGSGKRAAELSTAERQEIQMKKGKLISMLDEVDQRYRQYHRQMQMVISSFEQAAGIGSARTYTALALQTISKQFRCLKDAITNQIRAANKSLGEEDCAAGKIEGSRLKYVDHQLRQQRALQQLGMIQHNAWRPQRGLPERSVSVLRAWLFEHFLHPYPKDSDKHMLAKQTGLTRSQVSNWFISPLDHLAIIFGTLTLPTAIDASSSASSNTTPRCSYNTCFQFSDGSASICCDILDFDVRIIGKKISVLAWNFIPWKRGGGFLEIIRWSFQDSNSGLRPCSNFNSIPLGSGSSSGHEDSSRARHGVFGALEVVSPVSTVPCATGHSNLKTNKASDSSHSSSLRGFLLQFMVCECELCSSKEAVTVLKDSIQEKDAHSFNKPMFVYCSGSVSSWHPVFTKFVGNVVALSGLKKKLVFIGKEESKLMYVTTENSALHLLRLSWKWRPKCTAVAKGKGECGTYRGIVKGVYMQGMVVELDNEVWLLLTDQLLTPPHSLRAGALVSVRNVHFVNPRFSWTKILILGACFKTSVIVESFSPLETGCHILPQSQSSLGKFVESLTFSARLWVLLIASCFRKKFSGILSEKEILGTKHKGGFVQMYASSQFPSSMHPTRHGVFMELCNHDSSVCGCEPYIGNPNLVVPLSIFICHCEAFWKRAVQLENSCAKLHDDKKYGLQFCEGRSHVQSVRKIFSSEDIGVSLMGSLKTSPSSGRLQLVDATGSIDVLIPDLPSTWDANRIYKVADFSLVIEGMPQSGECIGLLDNDLFSCRTIFHFIPLARKMNLTVYVYFRLRNSMCRNLPIYPCTGPGEDLKRLESGMFHLLLVTHKFPVLQKYQDDVIIENSSSMFVEAIILPWDLFIAGSYEISCPTRAFGDNPKNSVESAGGNYSDHVSPKRRKVNHSSSRGLSSNSVNNSSESVREPNSCSISYKESREKQKYCDLTSREISCSAMISGVNGHSLVGSVILHCTRAKLNNGGFCRPSGQKVLLEFTSESFYKYQLLHIGCYYITKHDGEDSFCNLKDSSYSSSDNILIPCTTHLWSLSFTSDEICQNNSSPKCLPLDNSLRNNEVLSEHHNEVRLQMSPGNGSENSSDISLCLPENVISFGEVILKELEEGLIKPVVTAEGIPKISSCISLAMTAPLLSLDSNGLFPEGNLLSLCGHVIAVHSVEDNSINPYLNCQNVGDPLQWRFLQRAKSSCIHVLVDHHIVRLSGSLSGHAFPVGFGPGVDATFHRVLELRGQNRWMLTSVSFIVINSIRAVSFQNNFIKVDNESCSDKCSSPASYMQNAAPLDLVSSGLISELVKCLDFKPMRFHCRVVAIHILVLEKKFRNVNYQPKNHFRPYLVDIPLAGFVLDDGSSPCCCWANSERAATLLRLYEDFPLSAFESSGWTLKWVRKGDDACSATMYHLERILKNHDRITVKNFGSMFDSSYQDLAVSVSSDNALSSHDENLLKFIIFNACFSKFWTVIGRMMDSNAVTRLKTTNLLETEMSMHSMQHIWAREVHYTNPLTEARNVVQELC